MKCRSVLVLNYMYAICFLEVVTVVGYLLFCQLSSVKRTVKATEMLYFCILTREFPFGNVPSQICSSGIERMYKMCYV